MNRCFKIIALILIVLILIVIKLGNSKSAINNVSSSDLNKLLSDKSVIILDIRTENEYKESHIPKAINIPYNEIKNKVTYDKNAKIVVYSKNDSRVHLATLQLKKMGYKNIYEADMTDYNGKLVN